MTIYPTERRSTSLICVPNKTLRMSPLESFLQDLGKKLSLLPQENHLLVKSIASLKNKISTYPELLPALEKAIKIALKHSVANLEMLLEDTPFILVKTEDQFPILLHKSLLKKMKNYSFLCKNLNKENPIDVLPCFKEQIKKVKAYVNTNSLPLENNELRKLCKTATLLGFSALQNACKQSILDSLAPAKDKLQFLPFLSIEEGSKLLQQAYEQQHFSLDEFCKSFNQFLSEHHEIFHYDFHLYFFNQSLHIYLLDFNKKILEALKSISQMQVVHSINLEYANTHALISNNEYQICFPHIKKIALSSLYMPKDRSTYSNLQAIFPNAQKYKLNLLDDEDGLFYFENLNSTISQLSISGPLTDKTAFLVAERFKNLKKFKFRTPYITLKGMKQLAKSATYIEIS